MKKIMENFKQFLTEAQKSDYDVGGELMLFHYAPVDAEAIIVDPKYFADRAKRSHFTRNEYETSTVPQNFLVCGPTTKRKTGCFKVATLYQAPSQREKSMTSEMTLRDTRKSTDTQLMD